MTASPQRQVPEDEDNQRSPSPEGRARSESSETKLLRLLLLAIVLLGAVGLALELLLLEHYESFWQWSPFIVLGLVLASGVAVLVRPRRITVRAFRLAMVLCLVAGALGLFLHYRGNVEFERENEPSLRGLSLVWRALTGATPALAPGALAQLGLVGLAYGFRHPALRRRRRVRAE
jgi:hypothetical protein